MVGAVQHLVDEGRVSFFCVDSLDGWSWSDASVPTEERARRHAAYQAWLEQSWSRGSPRASAPGTS